MINNRRGWVEIVEAVVAILLVAAVLLITVNKGYIGKTDISEGVYKIELSILREIETNNSLRMEILEAPLPVEWDDFPTGVKDKIITRTPTYLECMGKICQLYEGDNPEAESVPCNLEEKIEKDVYSQSVIISSTLGEVTEGAVYRRLKLFCWTK